MNGAALMHRPVGLVGGRVSLEKAPVWLSSMLLALVVIVPTYDFRPGAEASFSIDPQLLLRMAICLACGAYGLLYGRKTQSALLRLPGAWAVVLCLWAALTIPLSVAPSYTAAACMLLWCVALFAPAVVGQLGQKRVLQTLLASMAVFVVLAWTLYFFVPSIGRSAYLVGEEVQYRVGGDAQQLGLQAMWLVGIAVVLGIRRELPWALVCAAVAVGGVTLIASQSRTSMIATVAIVGFLFLRHAPKGRVLDGLLLASLLGAVGLFAYGAGVLELHGDAVLRSVSRTHTQNEIYNITGRTEFWPYVLQQIGQSPVWGYGYGASRQALCDFNGESFATGQLLHAHNSVLNMTLSVGVVGGLIYVAMLLGLLDGLLRRRGIFPGVVLVALLLCGLTESVVFGPMPRSHTVLLLLALCWNQAAPGDKTDEPNNPGEASR